MTIAAGTNRGQLAEGTKAILGFFSKAREAISRVTIPGLSVYPDGAATIEDVTVNALTTSAIQPVQFVCGGFIVGVTASISLSSANTAATDTDYGCMKVAIKINGSTDIFQTGQQGKGFVSFAQLGAGSSGQIGMFRLMAPIVQQVPYQVSFKNVHASVNFTVDLTLWYANTTSPPITD